MLEIATLGGGCFWCLEAVFEQLVGVESVVSGYTGGAVANPTYSQICEGDTGHAEVVQVTFDRSKIAYEEILLVFFATHDPTTLNRQGADVGTQYRSAIFTHDSQQEQVSQMVIESLTEAKIWNRPIVTEVSSATTFYRAEDYHQEYFRNHPTQPYCVAVIHPKLAKFRKQFHDRVKS